MSDYIKREDAIKAVMNLTMYRGRVPIVNLKDIPSADVVPKDFHDKTCEAMAKRHTKEIQRLMPKRGEWIDAEIPLESGGSMPIQVCNLCKTFYPLAYTGGGHRFCPNCGAQMKGEDDE